MGDSWRGTADYLLKQLPAAGACWRRLTHTMRGARLFRASRWNDLLGEARKGKMMTPSDKRIVARWNRAVSDMRCWLGWRLFKLASYVTDASIHSSREWTWKRRKVPNT